MTNYEEIISEISNAIRTNGSQAITGAILQEKMLSILKNGGGNTSCVWLSRFKPQGGNIDKKMAVTIAAIKDVWFEFPNGTIPAWFSDRRPILRSISNDDYTYPTRLRIYFKGSETAYDEAYTADYLPEGGWHSEYGDYQYYNYEAIIEGTVIKVHCIVNGTILKANKVEGEVNTITSPEGLALMPEIVKKFDSQFNYPNAFTRNQTLLTDVGMYINYDTATETITVPSNTRMIFNNNAKNETLGSGVGTLFVEEGSYPIRSRDVTYMSDYVANTENINTLGWCDIYLGIDGRLYACHYGLPISKTPLMNTNKFVKIGWVHTIQGVFYLNAVRYSINGVPQGEVSGKAPYQRVTRFTVTNETTIPNETTYNAENIDNQDLSQYYDDNVVLYLPTTYSANGIPTKLILYCKQGGSRVTDTSDPVFSQNIFNYMLKLGYAVLAVDGMPDAWSSALGLDDTRVVGNYVAITSVQRAYNKVMNLYNLDPDGCYIFGYSQGGHFAQNVIDITDIPVKAAAQISPVCSMRYHQWDLAANVSVGGVNFSKAARLNVARIYGFPTITTDAELSSLQYDAEKVIGYDPWTRNVDEPYNGFTQGTSYGSHLWGLPQGTSIEDITMKKHIRCPLKIWAAENDAALGIDVMKVYIKAIRNAGQLGVLKLFATGGHSIQTNQTSIGTFVENGSTYNLYPIARDIAIWYSRFGGYNL